MGAFEVVILGFKLNGPASPARAVERVLGEPAESARALAKRFPCTVRAGLSRDAANALAEALRAEGARVEVRESSQQAAGAGPATNAPMHVAQAACDAHAATMLALPVDVAARAGHAGQAGAAEPPRAAVQPQPHENAPALTPEPHIVAPARSTGRYLLGTLKIMLGGGPPRPPAGSEPYRALSDQALAPAARPTPQELLYGTGMRDEIFDDPLATTAVELASESLAQRSNFVSGGRVQGERSSLMLRMRESFVDIPLRVVRRARPQVAPEPPQSRGRRVVVALVGGALLLGGVGHWMRGAGGPASAAPARVGHALAAEDESASDSNASEGDESLGLHPILQLAPKPMESALASIMRKRVAGVHTVSIDWGPSGAPEGAIQCLLVSGSATEREERVRALLTTGALYPLTPVLENQLRNHAEVLRIAEGNEAAQFTSLCMKN